MTTGLINVGSLADGLHEPAEVLAESHLTVLGAYRGTTYAGTKDGRELRLAGTVLPFETANPPRVAARDGYGAELWISQSRTEPDRRSRLLPAIVTVTHIRAYSCAPGTYAALVAAEDARTAAKAAAAARAAIPRRHDLAETFPALDAQPETFAALGTRPEADPTLALLRKAPRVVARPASEPVRGIEAIRAWIEAQGVALAAVGPYLDVRARIVPEAVREVLDAFGHLLVGLLSGAPVPCAMEHRAPTPAWTIAVGGLPVCRGCLDVPG